MSSRDTGSVKLAKAHSENVALKIEPDRAALNDDFGKRGSQQPTTVKKDESEGSSSKGLKHLTCHRIGTIRSQSYTSEVSDASTADTNATNCASVVQTKTQDSAAIAPTEWTNVMPMTLKSDSWYDVQDSGDEWLPSVGSKNHHLGSCKPCVFFRKKRGCTLGSACDFCHQCSADVLYLQRLRRRRGLNKPDPTSPLPVNDVPTNDVQKVKAGKKMRRKLRTLPLENNGDQ